MIYKQNIPWTFIERSVSKTAVNHPLVEYSNYSMNDHSVLSINQNCNIAPWSVSTVYRINYTQRSLSFKKITFTYLNYTWSSGYTSSINQKCRVYQTLEIPGMLITECITCIRGSMSSNEISCIIKLNWNSPTLTCLSWTCIIQLHQQDAF